MRRLGIHSFVWTGGQTQDGLEMALEKSAEHGYRMIEFAYLRPEKFDLDRLSRKAQELDIEIVVTMGLPAEADVSSEDPARCGQGQGYPVGRSEGRSRYRGHPSRRHPLFDAREVQSPADQAGLDEQRGGHRRDGRRGEGMQCPDRPRDRQPVRVRTCSTPRRRGSSSSRIPAVTTCTFTWTRSI